MTPTLNAAARPGRITRLFEAVRGFGRGALDAWKTHPWASVVALGLVCATVFFTTDKVLDVGGAEFLQNVTARVGLDVETRQTLDRLTNSVNRLTDKVSDFDARIASAESAIRAHEHELQQLRTGLGATRPPGATSDGGD